MMKKFYFNLRNALVILAVCILTTSLQAQSRSVTGKVTEASTKQPAVGASVVVKGTQVGTMVNAEGNFTIRASVDDILVISSIGYVTQEVRADRDNLQVELLDDTQLIDDVVVVGYGVQKKANLTGAVAQLSGDKIAANTNTDVLSALQGQMPGVAVLRSSGQPGSETSGIRIRGFSSANTASALVLIDGIEGDMTLLNADDIESISVLKDAAASAIYGARAAAGVILITTKKGTAGEKAKISYNGSFALNLPGNMPERLPAWEEQEFINLSRQNASGNPEWNPEQSSWVANPNYNYRPNTNGRWDQFYATNWVASGTKDYTTQHNHSVSISGGKEKTSYYLSGSFYEKEGLLRYGADDNRRINLRVNVKSELNNYMDLTVNASFNGSYTNTTSAGATTLLGALYRARGRQAMYVPEEDPNYDTQPYNGDLQINAIDVMKNGGEDNRRYEAYNGKVGLHIKNLVKGLTIDLNAARVNDYYNRQVDKRYLVWTDRNGAKRFDYNNPNSVQKVKNYTYHDTLEALVNYNTSWNKHDFSALAGASYENFKKDEIDATAKNLISNDFFSFNYFDTSEATNTTLKDAIQPWKMASFFGRINYAYDSRYLFEANLRYDGSSRLDPDRRWQVFPSFSGAWRVTGESWFKVRQIDNLKLRASWGELGNGAALSGYYPYLALVDNGKTMGNGYYYQGTMASPDITWETIQSTNIGLDLNMFNNRLSITADYYWKKNKDMLSSVQVGNIVGVNVPNQNVGTLKTWGWEVAVGWSDRIGELSYQVRFNIDDTQNKLESWRGTNVVSAGTVDKLQGYALNTIWAYKTDGYWNSREEYLAYKEANPGYQSFSDALIGGGDVRYLTQGNADHTVGAGKGTVEDHGDLVYMGTTNGRYYYGFNLDLQWKGFDFSMFWQGVGKRAFVVDAHTVAPFARTAQMPWTIHRDYWTPENTDAKWPRLYNYNETSDSAVPFNFQSSDRWVQNGAYIRLKNIQLGYTVPIKKSIVSKLRVYVSGSDVWEHSKVLKVFDPEVGNNKKVNDYYPFFRTWTAGVNITF